MTQVQHNVGSIINGKTNTWNIRVFLVENFKTKDSMKT